MSLIEKEKELLNNIATERYVDSNTKDYLKCNRIKESYYDKPRNCSYLEDYQFETPIEMKRMLEVLFSETELSEELLPLVIAATFKLRDKNVMKEEIMETIYNF